MKVNFYFIELWQTKMSKIEALVIGSGGFVGQNILKQIVSSGIQTKSFNRLEMNLLDPQSINNSLGKIKQIERIIFCAGEVPAKDEIVLFRNITMLDNLLEQLESINFTHFTYISSDAVYADSNLSINEDSLKQPSSFHGKMHLLREERLQEQFSEKLLIVRPTLIYGKEDPHNGYGPNKFMRSAIQNRLIELNGFGEELRDHIYIENVRSLISNLVINCRVGPYNICTDTLISFADIANEISDLFMGQIEIVHQARTAPPPHNGYRRLSNEKLKKVSPDLEFASIGTNLMNSFLGS